VAKVINLQVLFGRYCDYGWAVKLRSQSDVVLGAFQVRGNKLPGIVKLMSRGPGLGPGRLVAKQSLRRSRKNMVC
jgi:hypothetical protein